jgi:hypothetical protein
VSAREDLEGMDVAVDGSRRERRVCRVGKRVEIDDDVLPGRG